jgi:hypothetical protein
MVSLLFILFNFCFNMYSFHSTRLLKVNLSMWRSQGPNLKKVSHSSDISVIHIQVGVRYSCLESIVKSLY